MSATKNVALKNHQYAWIADFREALSVELDRRVTFAEAGAILIRRAAAGETPQKVAKSIAREQQNGGK